MARQIKETSLQKGDGTIFHVKVSPTFEMALNDARQRISQKESYTPEEAFQIARQGLREVYMIHDEL